MIQAALLGNWRLIGVGLLLAGLAGQYAWLQHVSLQRDNAVLAKASAETDLARSEQGKATLANRLREEAERRAQAEQREFDVNAARRAEANLARSEHERITSEIMQALGAEVCTAVPVPVGAVVSLRHYAAYANGISDDLPGPLPSDSLVIE